MNRSESKFHNTAVRLDNALIELLEKKDFSEISIKDICEKAGVNRSTFYLHYENTYDLLKETRQLLIDNFTRCADFGISLRDIPTLSADELIFASPKYIVPYLEFIKANKKIFTVYMSNLNYFDGANTDKLLLKNVLIPVYEKNGITDKNTVTYMSKFFLSGITAITLEWVKRNCIDDVMFVCELICACIRPLAE